MASYFLKLVWGNRQEGVEACAKAWSLWLGGLAEIDGQFATWYEQGRSRQAALKHRVDFQEVETLRKLLLKGRNKRDSDRTIIEELGFNLSLWNGLPNQESSKLSGICGLFAANSKVQLTNVATLRFPASGEGLHRLLARDVLLKLFELGAFVWRPDYGVFSSVLPPIIEENGAVKVSQVDWMHYLTAKVELLPPLPLTAGIVPLSSHGTIVIASNNDSIEVGDSEDGARAALATSSALRATGLLP